MAQPPTCPPIFTCPDADLTAIFAFRAAVFLRHCRSGPDGWVVSEFLPDVPWAGPRNTISCAAHLHLLEGRWLVAPQVLDDYARSWLDGRGDLRAYSNALITALHRRALASGDWRLPLELLDAAATHWRRCLAEHRHASGLAWSHDDRDGGEYSLSGPGLRPILNSYLASDAAALAAWARRAGRHHLAEEFAAAAADLCARLDRLLWDPRDGFYKTLPLGPCGTVGYPRPLGVIPPALRDAPLPAWDGARPPSARDARELWGFFPWAYGCAAPGRTAAWAQLGDPLGFAGPWGPRSAERRHPGYGASQAHECLWNGPSWPFATCQMIMGLADLLHRGEPAPVGRKDYFHWLSVYARSQHRVLPDGHRVPWIDENLDPDTGAWLARERLHAQGRPDRERGVDYNHSTFCDLVITGLCGLVPREDDWLEVDPLLEEAAWDEFRLAGVPYHGYRIDITWQRGKGGLQVHCDGACIGHAERLRRICVPLPGAVRHD